MEPRVKEPIPLPTYTRWTRKAYTGRVTASVIRVIPVALSRLRVPRRSRWRCPQWRCRQDLQGADAQLQTDFQTLQTDEKALQAQIPASLTAAVKTDQAIIQKAFSSLTPTQLKALHPGGPPSGTTSSNPTANLTATLTAAGVSSSEINTITTDFQNLENAMTTTDPTLQAKIAADKAAIVQDGGPSLPTNAHGFRMPGMF